jgi:NAD(P)-dependent dehydrogenase (short-subunit alcohol dehydrogenase family)
MLEGFDLSGRVAVVTGGGTGIGRDTALLLAERGADVAVSGRRAEPLEKTADDIRALGRKALAVPSDARKPDQCKALIDAVAKEFGRIDIRSTTPAARTAMSACTGWTSSSGTATSSSISARRNTARRRRSRT